MAVLPMIVFDVNETLLDLQTMEPIFERICGEKRAMRLWFATPLLAINFIGDDLRYANAHRRSPGPKCPAMHSHSRRRDRNQPAPVQFP